MSIYTGLKFDPLYQFQGYDGMEILEICGLLPQWALDKNFLDKGIVETMSALYGFPIYPLDGATVDENGVMRYPGDPDSYPLLKIIRGTETMYQYKYGFVAFVTEAGTMVTRMD